MLDAGLRARLRRHIDPIEKKPLSHHLPGTTAFSVARQTFLQQVCAKAGMNPNCWKDENTDIFRFTAGVFGEKEQGMRGASQGIAEPPSF